MQLSRFIARRPSSRWKRGGWLAWLVLLAPLGCVPLQMVAPSPAPLPPAPEEKVEAGGGLSESRRGGEAGRHRREVSGPRQRSPQGGAFREARRFIHRYPDVAQETLLNAGSDQAPNSVLQWLARAHDEQCGSAGANADWSALLQDRAGHADRYTAYDAARRQYRELIHSGKAHEAAALSLPRKVPTPFLEIEAWRLQGEALLLAEQPAEAVGAFEAALKRAETGHPYEAAQVMLLLGEAHRRAGKKEDGAGSWQQAVVLAGQLLVRPLPVLDPILWERAAYLRPVQSGWPEPVIKQLVPPGSNPVIPGEPPAAKTGLDEAWLWAASAAGGSTAASHREAPVAFKRAESLTLDQHFQQQLQLSQAQAMAQLGLSSAAMPLLVHLAGDATCPAACPALAMLGALKLKDGSSQQGLALLQKAVEQGTLSDWPGRCEAEADLGLAYLMVGEDAKGLHWLHIGQEHFGAVHDHESLMQSLDNEANYLEHLKKPDEARRIRQRMKALEKTS